MRSKRLKITMSPRLLRTNVTILANSAQAIVFISAWLTLMVKTNVLLCLSAPTLEKLKIGKRQILSRLFEGPTKFRQSSASRP